MLYDYLIPIVVYAIILLFFGFTIFKWAVLAGLIIGFFVLVWLFLEKDSKYAKKFEKIEKTTIAYLKRVWNIIWN
jgi:ABC-type transport system involved in cytochrome bd biosynthesis fused ATPase/permease subunit